MTGVKYSSSSSWKIIDLTSFQNLAHMSKNLIFNITLGESHVLFNSRTNEDRVTQKLIVSIFSEEKSHTVFHKKIGCMLYEYVMF